MTTAKLQYLCLRCQALFTYAQAQQHEQETGHAIEVYQESRGPFRVFVEPYAMKEKW